MTSLAVADQLWSAFGAGQVGQVDAIIFAPDIREPVPNIAAQHEGVVRGILVPTLIGYKFTNGTEATSTCS